MERMPLMGKAHQKRSGMRPDEGGALRSNAFHAFSLAASIACKRKFPFLQTDKVSADTLSFYVYSSSITAWGT